MLPLGSLANAFAILAGGVAGMVLGDRLPERVRAIVFQGLGLAVVLVGMQMALSTRRPLLALVCLVAGAVVGELANLEQRFLAVGERAKRLVKSANSRFSEGAVGASLIFCIGSMAIVGALDEGLRGAHDVLFTKAVLDGFASVALAATYGSGVLLSALPVFCYQAGISLCAGLFSDAVTPAFLGEVSGVGGALIVGIGINLLLPGRVRTANFIPAMLLLPILAGFPL